MSFYCIKMERYLLDTASDHKDLLIKMAWRYDISGGENYNINKWIKTKTSMLWADLCNFSDAHIVVKAYITITEPNYAKRNI